MSGKSCLQFFYSILFQQLDDCSGDFSQQKFGHVDFCSYFCTRFPQAEDDHGEMPEWSIGAVSKTVDQLAGPRVRIPVSPPRRTANLRLFFFCCHLYHEAVGGEDGGGEEGGGLVEEELGLLVAGGDVGEQEAVDAGEGGETGGLRGGEVLALAGKVGKVVGEGTLEA